MLKQKFLVHFGSSFTTRIMGLFAGIIVARIAGPEVVGTIAYGTSYVGVWGFFLGFFGSGHIKLVSEGQDMGKCMSVYTRLFLGSLAIYFAVVSGVFLIQKYVTPGGFESKTQETVIILLLFVHVFNTFYNYSSTTFTATMEQARANLPMFLKSIAWQTGRILVVILGFRAVGLASWNLIVTVLFLPLVYKLIKKYPKADWDKKLFKKYMGYAVPILLIVVINSIVQYSDKLFLAHYTDTTELGYYSAAYSIGGLIILASVSIGNIFFPLFSSLLAQNDWPGVRKKILQYQEFLSIFVFPLVCLLALIAGPLLTTVLGTRYEPSIVPFMIIGFATYVLVAGMPYGNTITGAGRFYLNVLINLLKLMVFVVSITLFIAPRFLGLGAVGLALNLLVINLLTNVLYQYFSRRLSGLSFFNLKNLLRYLLVFSLSLGLFLAREYFSRWLSLWWIAIIPLYLLLIYGLLFALGLFSKEDIKKLLDLVDIKKLFGYVKDELKDK